MAKRRASTVFYHRNDLSAWNFIIFLTLAFILLVLVLSGMNKVSFDLRSRAGLTCPEVTLPQPEDCSGQWIYKRDAGGCIGFVCMPKPTVAPKKK